MSELGTRCRVELRTDEWPYSKSYTGKLVARTKDGDLRLATIELDDRYRGLRCVQVPEHRVVMLP